MTPYDQRIEALMGIVHAAPPPRRYEVEVRHG